MSVGLRNYIIVLFSQNIEEHINEIKTWYMFSLMYVQTK